MATNSKPSVANSRKAERRESFRVNQDVLFDYKTIDSFAADTVSAEEAFGDTASLGVLNELHRIDKHNQELLKLFGDKNRLLADYMRGINQKIDLISRHVLFAKPGQGQENVTQLNLSETGLAFVSERALYKDSYIALRLIFLPNYVPVTAMAKITRCDVRDDSYILAAHFHRLQDQQRQELARQILKAQVKAK